MVILRLILSRIMSVGGLITIGSSIIILIICIVLEKRDKKLAEERAEREIQEALIRELKTKSPDEVADSLGLKRIKTINVFRSCYMQVNQHNLMIGYLETHLKMNGFKICMVEEDLDNLRHWVCPVLVIVPQTKMFFYHSNQLENRTSSRSFEILTNSLGDLYGIVDKAIEQFKC